MKVLFLTILFLVFSQPLFAQSTSAVDITTKVATKNNVVDNKDPIIFKSDPVFAIVKKKVKAEATKQKALSKDVVNLGVSTLFMDTMAVVKTFPGVVSYGDASALMYVRGGNAYEVLTISDNHFYQWSYFFGGLVSLINPMLVDSITFYSSSFPARYGNVTSAIVDVTTKTGDLSKYSLELNSNLTQSNLLISGPIQKYYSSFLVSARRTYYDKILGALISDDTIFPYFEAYSIKLHSEHLDNHEVTLLGNIFHEKADLRGENKNLEDGSLIYDSSINVAQIEVDSTWTSDLSSEVTAQYETFKSSYKIEGKLPINVKGNNDPIIILGGELLYTGFDRHTIRTGVMKWAQEIDGEFFFTREPTKDFPEARTETRFNKYQEYFDYLAVYFEDELELIPKKLAVNAGIRAETVLTPSLTNLDTFQPRMTWYFGDRSKSVVTLGVGKYSQFSFRVFNNQLVNLEPFDAIHYTLGYEKNWKGFMFRSDFFYKDYNNLSRQVLDQRTGFLDGYDNQQTRKAYGIELFLQKKVGDKLDGWISYTFSDVQFKEPGIDWTYENYDQRHSMNIVGNYRFNKRWKLSGKSYYGSGKPYTDVVSSRYVESEDLYIPINAPKNSKRLPVHFALDIWFEYQRRFFSSNVSFLFGATNILNRKNVITYSWDDSFKNREPVTNLPLLPFLGVNVKY